MYVHLISSYSGIEIYHLCCPYEDSSVSFLIEFIFYLFKGLDLEINSSEENPDHYEFSLFLVQVC